MCTVSGTRRRAGSQHEEQSDEELLLEVRAGVEGAYGEIYRRYSGEARVFARSLVGEEAADDVVAEAFTKVLQALRSGHGPVDRPVRYLMVAVRSSANDLHNRRTRDRDLNAKLQAPEGVDDAAALLGDDPLVVAFQSLSSRWRQVIWWSEIEGQSPSEIGLRLGIKPAAAAALTYRARRALREAFLGSDDDAAAAVGADARTDAPCR